MLTVNIPRLASKGPLKFDVAAEFEKIFGFSLADHTKFMSALLMHAMTDHDARQDTVLVWPNNLSTTR
jgi:hypothetical protein